MFISSLMDLGGAWSISGKRYSCLINWYTLIYYRQIGSYDDDLTAGVTWYSNPTPPSKACLPLHLRVGR